MVGPYTFISRRAKDVEVCFKTSSRGTIQHLIIGATGLEVCGGGEWKVKKHGTAGKLQAWRKPHLAVDTDTHEIITV
ncbi:transposase [Vibrio alginolyticus]|nr:transposase [Vibrio alginolyticus]MDA0407336.1 transposase [Vibrio alginolyticus]